MEWWVFPALVLCAVTFTAAAGVLVFLAVRGVWRLLAAYRREPAHAARLGETREGRSWMPWDTDPRFGSMQFDADRVLTAYELGIPVEPDMAWREMVALGEDIGDAPPWPAPPRDWREVAHEGDWRAQTAADLAPATLDSGPGGPSLAPGPDWTWGEGARSPVASQPGIAVDAAAGNASAQWQPEMTPVAALPPPEPEPVHTVAGRLVETSDEWLRRLVADAAPGWTYAAA